MGKTKSNKSGNTVAGRTIAPLAISEVDEVPSITREHSLVNEVKAALDGKKGTFKVREYTSWSPATAFARSLKKAGLDACTRKMAVYVTMK